jgi:hypothetical protein
LHHYVKKVTQKKGLQALSIMSLIKGCFIAPEQRTRPSNAEDGLRDRGGYSVKSSWSWYHRAPDVLGIC